ncbi:MAG TPA: ABC transporter substrate-binding protein [bacterium]|nr:ABC transporter substrate-binding protein [bacterium]
MGELGLSLAAVWAVLDRATARPARGAAPGRGAHGTLRLLYWQAPTILNPNLAGGTKDSHGSRVVLEPLFTADAAGTLSPVLAAQVPTRQNGGLAADGRSVTFRLKQGVRRADGRPFTSDDVIFTHHFAANRQTGATSYASYENVAKVEPLNASSVKVSFKDPTPFWFRGFVGASGAILPRHRTVRLRRFWARPTGPLRATCGIS